MPVTRQAGRRARGRAPGPRPESVKRAADGYALCPGCGHHTSAYCGSCTVMVKLGDSVVYCGCDCAVALGGPSLADVIAGLLREDQ